MSHIFGIPHSIGEIASGVLGSFVGSIASPVPTFPAAFSPTNSAYEIATQAVDYFGGTNVAGTTVSEVVIDNATGQCIAVHKKKTRKRKRRLATLSDIKDLAALKQVLGGGKAFDTWIATRGR